MAGLMDFLGGMGGMFGGTGAYDDLLTPEQKKAMQQQTMMTMAAKLLQAGGPSTTPTNLGQALGGAFLTGQEAYSQAGQNAVQQMLAKQKIEEYRQEQARKAKWEAAFGIDGAAPTGPMTPSQALAAPSMPLGPTTQRAAMIGQMPTARMPQAGGAAQSLQQTIQSLTPTQRAVIGSMPPKEGMAKLLEIQQGQVRSMTSEEVARAGLPAGTVAQRTSAGEIKVVRTPDLAPNDIRLLQGVGLDPTWENLQKLKKSGASSTTLVTPPGQTAGREAVDKKYAEDYLQWTQGGGADAIGNVAQIGTVLQQLEQGRQLTGPMIGIQPDFILALTNPNAADAKQRVEEVVQRNLRTVLGAQFTEKEGERLIARAYNPTLSPQQNAARLRRLFQQMQIAANSRQEMAQYFEENGTLTGYKGPRVNINQFYDALEVKTPPKAGDTVQFNGRTLKFKGGDPNQESNWEEI